MKRDEYEFVVVVVENFLKIIRFPSIGKDMQIKNDEFFTYFWPEIKFKCHTNPWRSSGRIISGRIFTNKSQKPKKTKENHFRKWRTWQRYSRFPLDHVVQIIDWNNPSSLIAEHEINLENSLFPLKFHFFYLRKKRHFSKYSPHQFSSIVLPKIQ